MASGWGVGGRPTVHFERRLEDYPPPTPQPTPCRLWQGAVDRDGYGIINVTTCDMNRPITPGRQRVPRWIWQKAYGPIKTGLVVRHKCDNRPCYRLSHLELGTVADNNRDTIERNHGGRPPLLSPTQVERLRAERAEGRSYRTIYNNWPEIHDVISFSGMKALSLRMSKDPDYVPAPPAPPGHFPRDLVTNLRKAERAAAAELTKYSDWRTKGPS